MHSNICLDLIDENLNQHHKDTNSGFAAKKLEWYLLKPLLMGRKPFLSI